MHPQLNNTAVSYWPICQVGGDVSLSVAQIKTQTPAHREIEIRLRENGYRINAALVYMYCRECNRSCIISSAKNILCCCKWCCTGHNTTKPFIAIIIIMNYSILINNSNFFTATTIWFLRVDKTLYKWSLYQNTHWPPNKHKWVSIISYNGVLPLAQELQVLYNILCS